MAIRSLRVGSRINWVFWRGEDKAAKEGEAGILLIRRCSLTLAAVAADRQNAEVIFEPSLRRIFAASPATAEYWNDGMMEVKKTHGCKHPNIPIFHYSNAPSPVIASETGNKRPQL